MLSYEIHKDDGVIVMTSVGETTFDDYQTVGPKFYADVKSHGIRKVLVDSRKFEGWDSKKSESLAFTSWTQARSVFDRIAVVIDDRARSELSRFMEFFENAGKDVRVFPPSKYETALEWLRENETA